MLAITSTGCLRDGRTKVSSRFSLLLVGRVNPGGSNPRFSADNALQIDYTSPEEDIVDLLWRLVVPPATLTPGVVSPRSQTQLKPQWAMYIQASSSLTLACLTILLDAKSSILGHKPQLSRSLQGACSPGAHSVAFKTYSFTHTNWVVWLMHR